MKTLCEKLQKARAKRNMENVIYTAVVLTEDSAEKLKDHVTKYMPNWKTYSVHCHHSTIYFHTLIDENPDLCYELYDWCKENEGKIIKLTAYEYGISDKAFAVKVESDSPTANELKHITIATNNNPHGNAVDSNYITDWKAMPEIKLEGVVTFMYKH